MRLLSDPVVEGVTPPWTPAEMPAYLPVGGGLRPSMTGRTMNDFDQTFLDYQRAEQARRAAAGWLSAFENALEARDPARMGALFHEDSHWRDVLAFTWHMTPIEGREAIAARLSAEQART